MCKGEWEIWANGFHEEGAEELRGNDRTMMIPRSEGWNSFTESVAATVESPLLRSKLAKDWDGICFEEGNLVAAEVICCSGACVHGILAGRLPAHPVLY